MGCFPAVTSMAERLPVAPGPEAFTVVLVLLDTVNVCRWFDHVQVHAIGRQRAVPQLRKRRHPNVVAVAITNKNARIVWSILSKNENYSGPETPQPV